LTKLSKPLIPVPGDFGVDKIEQAGKVKEFKDEFLTRQREKKYGDEWTRKEWDERVRQGGHDKDHPYCQN
jgi:hypothetical protein